MRVAVVGGGAVGSEAVRRLVTCHDVEAVTLVVRDRRKARAARKALGSPARLEVRAAGPASLGRVLHGSDVTVLAVGGPVRVAAAAALGESSHVVAACDDPSAIRSLFTLDVEARERGLAVVAGACLAPGLSCVLAAQAAAGLDEVEEVHVASVGTGGPACARRHHAALSSVALDWHDGAWRRLPGGSGRELVWFPEPVGGADCYRAALADPLLLVPAFPGVRRVTARLEATRRDRMTAWMPMLRPPHPEGTVGAVRAEVRGWRDGLPAESILGAVVRPALGAGLVAAEIARRAAGGRLRRAGTGGAAQMVTDPGALLADLRSAGVRTALFEGSSPET